jgi:anti-sigma factor RsiW
VSEPTDDVLSAYLDDELAPDERDRLSARLDADPVLHAQLDEVAEVRSLVRSLAAPVPPAGFVDELLAVPADDLPDAGAGSAAAVVDLAESRARRRRGSRFAALVAVAAAAVALVVAVAVPGRSATRPALATDVRVHQAGAAANGDPVSGLAPLVAPIRFGR